MTARYLCRYLLAPLLVAGCSTASPEPTDPSSIPPAYADDSPEGRCLADAAAPRTPPADAQTRISVAQILVRHRELARPEGATLTRGEACLRALAALEALQGGADWNAVVDEYSDAGKTTHGRLGNVTRSEVTGAFGDAAFSLSPNELSYVVESDRGFHIILREE